MGIIDGKAPPAKQTEMPARLVVKLVERHANQDTGAEARSLVSADLKQLVNAEFRPYFTERSALRAASVPPFDRYLIAELPDRGAAEAAARRLAALPEVDEAYVEGGPYPPPVTPGDDPRSASQGYLDAAPGGLDARWAWGVTDGAGVGFVDLEQGWTLSHEDLSAAGIGLISGVSSAYHGHGTAVLGEVVGVDNTLGVVGMAPKASARVVSQYRTATNYSTAEAILSAAQAMSVGDVLLLEAQTGFNGLSNLPVEVEVAVFDAIRHAVDAGIVVIEAGGNGSNDLDTFVDSANRQRLNRASSDFRDSGAIMVGAASSTTPHSRLWFSNFGSRIDCFGWGENINTTGDGWQGTSTTAYTTSFGGTSGASPMVAAAALLMQSWRKKTQQLHYNPEVMRDLLSAASTNTASGNPATDRIGVMPNLRGIIEQQQDAGKFRLHLDKYLSVVYILFGIINDAPGMIWVPGKGPVPIDPGWKHAKLSFTGAQRDLLVGLATQELAGMMEDRGSATQLAKAAADAMQQAVRRMTPR
jgi:hypothetical protein